MKSPSPAPAYLRWLPLLLALLGWVCVYPLVCLGIGVSYFPSPLLGGLYAAVILLLAALSGAATVLSMRALARRLWLWAQVLALLLALPLVLLALWAAFVLYSCKCSIW